MKKHLPLIFFVILLFVLSSFSGMHAQTGGKTYPLKMRLAKGDSFTHAIDMNMTMEFANGGQAMSMVMDNTTATVFRVLDASPGERNLSMTYTSMKATMTMNGQESPDEEAKQQEIASKVIGKTLFLKLDDKNAVTDVSGFEKAFAADSANPVLKQMFGKDQLNTLFGMIFQVYPDNPVSIGETWQKESGMNMGGLDVKLEVAYKLSGVANGIATVTMEGKLKGNGKMMPGDIDMNLDGQYTGSIDIKLSDGYMKSSHMKMDADATALSAGQSIKMKEKINYDMKGN